MYLQCFTFLLMNCYLCSSNLISAPNFEELVPSEVRLFGTTIKDLYVTEGDVVEMLCYGARDYINQLTWSKAGRRLRNYRRISFSSTTSEDYYHSKLTISNVTRGWAGKFTCDGTTIRGDDLEDYVYLHVQEPPKPDGPHSSHWPAQFGVTKRHVNARKGDTVELHCGADTDSISQISWRKDRHTLKSYGKMSINNVIDNNYNKSTLTILDVDEGTKGKYTCKGLSKLGYKIYDDVYLHLEG